MTPRESASARLLIAGVLVLAALHATPTLAQPAVTSVAQLAGPWTSDDWGAIELRADGTGTYASTYGTGPGRLSLRRIGGRFVGTWGESAQRHGTLTLELAPDGRTLTGTWTPDPHCTLGTTTGGTFVWTRR